MLDVLLDLPSRDGRLHRLGVVNEAVMVTECRHVRQVVVERLAIEVVHDVRVVRRVVSHHLLRSQHVRHLESTFAKWEQLRVIGLDDARDDLRVAVLGVDHRRVLYRDGAIERLLRRRWCPLAMALVQHLP